jgi:hypothetical protein
MTGKGGISGTGLTALAGGSLLLWSAIAGRAWSDVLRELIKGQKPTTTTDYPVTAAVANTATSAAAAGAQGGLTGVPPGPGAKQVCASQFGGPNDHTGTHGYHGDDLRGTMAFAELGMGHALGGLPYKAQARITFNGKSVIATKLDIGLGGAGCGGHARAVDLWWETARAIGFNGLGVVTFEPM